MTATHKKFNIGSNRIKILIAVSAVLLTLLTVSCGKSNNIKKNKVENSTPNTEKFSTDFFYNCNLPYEKLQLTDVQNNAEEYLFYIPNGSVYRTLNDYAVVIVARSDIREESDKIGTDYSGELYQIFEDDNIDLLKFSAAGDYAIMAVPSAIPNWEEDQVIVSFMEYAANYKSE